MKLTDTKIRNAKPKEKDYRLSDGQGLYILIKTNGAKWWRLDYTINGKRKTLSLGTYPKVSLADVRIKAMEAHQQAAKGIDPSDTRKATKQQNKTIIENEKRIKQGLPVLNSFEYVAMEWYEVNLSGKSETHKHNTQRILKSDVLAFIGQYPIAEVTAPQLIEVLERIQNRSIETAHRALSICTSIFHYAIHKQYCEKDITIGLKKTLKKRDKGHFAAITEPLKLGELLRAIDAYSGSFVVKTALQLAPLVFVRPSELCAMQWQDLDLEAKEWRYFVSKTKVNHIVPLSNQAVLLLSELKQLTGHHEYCFVFSTANKPITPTTLTCAIRYLGYEANVHTTHGFRATARTLLDEILGFRPDVIEHQLAHTVKDPNGRAYNRTQHLKERHNMMQEWSDYLDSLKHGAVVIPFNKTA